MKVKDIMQTEVRYLDQDCPAKDAFYTIINQHISGLPVIDQTGKLTGMFTEKDVLQYMLPSYVEKVGSFTYGDIPKSIINKLAALENLRVKDIMRKNVTTVTEESSLAEAARIVLTQKIRRLLVVQEGKVCGIIAREDILKAFAKEAGILRRVNE